MNKVRSLAETSTSMYSNVGLILINRFTGPSIENLGLNLAFLSNQTVRRVSLIKLQAISSFI